MLSVHSVDEHLHRLATPVACVELPLGRVAGRCLRVPLVARRPAPPFDRVMMDGFALQASAVQSGKRQFRVIGTAPAGTASPKLDPPDAAIEVMTGAVLPFGADCVVPVEDCTVRGNTVELRPGAVAVPGKYIHACGLDYARGDLVLAAGARLHPAHLALAASEGHRHLLVNADIRVQVITTGDEVIEAGSEPMPWQIFGTHAATIEAALSTASDIQFHARHVPDTLANLVEAIGTCGQKGDVLILCGGMSKGGKDFGIEALQQCGFQLAFHRVAQRPGHPMALATRGQTLLFGLPGNPLAVLFTLYRYVLPTLNRLRGCANAEVVQVAVAGELPALSDATRFVPCRLQGGQAHLALPHNSGDLQHLANSDGFVEIPPAETARSPFVPFWAW